MVGRFIPYTARREVYAAAIRGTRNLLIVCRISHITPFNAIPRELSRQGANLNTKALPCALHLSSCHPEAP